MRKIILEQGKFYNERIESQCFYVDDPVQPTITYTWPWVHLPNKRDYKEREKHMTKIRSEYLKVEREMFMETYPYITWPFGFTMRFVISEEGIKAKNRLKFSTFEVTDIDTNHRYIIPWTYFIPFLNYIEAGYIKVEPGICFKGAFVITKRPKRFFIKPIPLFYDKVRYA